MVVAPDGECLAFVFCVGASTALAAARTVTWLRRCVGSFTMLSAAETRQVQLDAEARSEEWEKRAQRRPLRLLLVRHAESVVDTRGSITGRANWAALTPQGRLHARALGRRLLEEGVDLEAIYSSPAVRAFETAELVCRELGLSKSMVPEVVQVSDVLELSEGSFDGSSVEQTYDDPKTVQEVRRNSIFFTPPGQSKDGENGESQYDVERRMVKFISGLLEPLATKGSSDVSTVAIFGHSNAIRCFIRHVLGASGVGAKIALDNASITELHYKQGIGVLDSGWTVVRLNDTSHLTKLDLQMPPVRNPDIPDTWSTNLLKLTAPTKLSDGNANFPANVEFDLQTPAESKLPAVASAPDHRSPSSDRSPSGGGGERKVDFGLSSPTAGESSEAHSLTVPHFEKQTTMMDRSLAGSQGQDANVKAIQFQIPDTGAPSASAEEEQEARGDDGEADESNSEEGSLDSDDDDEKSEKEEETGVGEPEEEEDPAKRAERECKDPKLTGLDSSLSIPRLLCQAVGKVTAGQGFQAAKQTLVVSPTLIGITNIETEDSALNSSAANEWLERFQAGTLKPVIACEKGIKGSGLDYVPNQDNFSFTRLQDDSMALVVADGHGPYGHLVSFRVAQTIPHYALNALLSGQSPDSAMKEAFSQAQKDLQRFAEQKSLDLKYSGSACTLVLVLGSTLHIAWLGDCQAMLFKPGATAPTFATGKHSPSSPREAERLRSNGAEVRAHEGGDKRVYLPGKALPGLAMSRALGDFSVAVLGVTHEPDVHSVNLDGERQLLLLASDGVWEFLDFDKALDVLKHGLKKKGCVEALRQLLKVARGRWKHFEGEGVCDDITAMLLDFRG